MPQKFEWTSFDKSPWKTSCYTVGLSEKAIKIAARQIPQGYDKPFSYSWLVIMLFGLKPNDFFHYIQYKYKAIIETTQNSFYKVFYFPTVVDGYEFAKEVERRFKLCLDEGYFGEEYDTEL